MKKKWKRLMAGICVTAMGVGVLTPFGVTVQSVQAAETFTGREVLNFNSDWGFYRGDLENAENPSFDDSEFANVTLPHTMQLAKKHCPGANGVYQGVGWYRRYFTLDESYANKKIQIQFEGVMTDSDVYLNGEKIYTRNGGYVGFTVDITDKIKFGETNVLALRVSKVDNPETPPGKPEGNLDFHYWGGIYRDVNMIVTEKTSVTDALEADQVGGGGVFLTYPEVSQEEATVNVKTDVANDNEEAHEVYVKQTLETKEGQVVVERQSEAQEIAADESYQFSQDLVVSNPHLWGIDDPYLYNLVTEVYEDGVKIDEVENNAGIRTIDFKSDGFYLNGERVYLRGANRHQAYQNVGDAAPNSMQYRDALQIKQNGFNAIRAAHYPQDPAFLDACDELGIVIIECQPGWQNFTNTQTFYDRTIRDTREMIRRDRNHPCVVLWEASLNETNTSDQWARDAIAAAREEYPGDQLFLASDYGYHGELYDVCYKVQDTQWSDNQDDWVDFDPEKPFFTREWGDWEWSSKALRKDGENQLNTQIYTRERYLNGNGYSDWGGLEASDRIGGHFLWSWNDYARGSNAVTLGSGTVDIDRYEKNGYYWFQSMMPKDNPMYGAMVYISSDYTEKSSLTVPVFSNCDSVRLYQNGNLVKEITREEAGQDVPNIMKKGGSPTFEFQLSSFEAGTLVAEGIVDGEVVCTHEVNTPGEAAALEIEIGDRGVEPEADGSDLVPVYIKVVDENGTIVPDYAGKVHVEVTGNGALVGEDIPRIQVQDQTPEKGIGFAFVRTSMEAGEIQITATAEGLEDGAGTVITKTTDDIFVPDGEHTEWTNTEADLEDPAYNYKNIAVGKQVIASSVQPGNGAERLTDGDETTRWCAENNSLPQWVEVDLGAVNALNGFQMIWENSGTTYQYKIQVSNDRINYETVVDMTNSNQANGELETQLQKTEGRYVRLTVTGSNNGWASLYEFKIIPDEEAEEPEPGELIPDSAVDRMEATSSAQDRGPEKLRDGVTEIGSGWLSESREFPQTVTVYFEKPQTLLGSRIYWEKDSSWYTYDLEITKDGTTWEPVIQDLRVGGQHYKPETFAETEENVIAARVTIKNVEAGGVYQIGMAEWMLYGYEYKEPEPEPIPEYEYLSDLQWTSAHSDYTDVKKDEAAYGGKLVLNTEEGQREFDKGLGADTNSEIIYTLEEGKYDRFEAYIGINAAAGRDDGEAVFRVYGDDELLYESPVKMRDENCEFVSVDISGVTTLKLEAVWYGDGRYGTHVDWADAKIYTKKAAEELSTDILKYTIDLAKTADTTGVIDTVKANFEKALADAEKMLADAEAGTEGITQEMVDASWQNLIKAMQYLSFKQGDKTDLEKVIAMAQGLDLSLYLDEGQQAFKDALAVAQNVLADGDAMQDEVDQAWKDLLKAMSELRLKPNKDALKNLIDEAEGMNIEGADEEVAAVFRNALAAAVAVYDNEQATEEEVVKATADLQAAVDKIQASTGDTEDEQNENNSGTENTDADNSKSGADRATDNTAADTTAKSAKTGDMANPATAMEVMMLAGVAVLICIKCRKDYKK
ncbi:discoidin domain-containing protein [Lachnoclostridium sp. An181]|uniref:discoidin domain-containing protein n=1 Tax=Lachnoclostridium sp. An181 TaxID=1965575 RepID=UPI0013A617EA|nr:discoidin domain-containing protein [Lachnoclostridium sp. An181]